MFVDTKSSYGTKKKGLPPCGHRLGSSTVRFLGHLWGLVDLHGVPIIGGSGLAGPVLLKGAFRADILPFVFLQYPPPPLR